MADDIVIKIISVKAVNATTISLNATDYIRVEAGSAVGLGVSGVGGGCWVCVCGCECVCVCGGGGGGGGGLKWTCDITVIFEFEMRSVLYCNGLSATYRRYIGISWIIFHITHQMTLQYHFINK